MAALSSPRHENTTFLQLALVLLEEDQAACDVSGSPALCPLSRACFALLTAGQRGFRQDSRKKKKKTSCGYLQSHSLQYYMSKAAEISIETVTFRGRVLQRPTLPSKNFRHAPACRSITIHNTYVRTSLGKS